MAFRQEYFEQYPWGIPCIAAGPGCPCSAWLKNNSYKLNIVLDYTIDVRNTVTQAVSNDGDQNGISLRRLQLQTNGHDGS